MSYTPEEGTPDRMDNRHVGAEILYRLPNQAVLSQGTVKGFSPRRQFVQIGRHWLPNVAGTVLCVLNKAKKRETPYDES